MAFIQIFFMFPETVGRSLEEIEEIFRQGHTFTAWKISRDVGKQTLKDVMDKLDDIEVRMPFPQTLSLFISCIGSRFPRGKIFFEGERLKVSTR